MKKILSYISIGVLIVGAIVFIMYQNEQPDVIDISKYGHDSEAIQKGLNKAKTEGKVEILIPAGNYEINETLLIYENTKIVMEEDTVLVRKHPGSFMSNGKAGDQFTGYKGNGNIIIEGGTLDGNVHDAEYGAYGYGGIAFAHAEKIEIRNLTIKDIVFSHAIEMNSSRNVLIENCQFLGYLDPTTDESRSKSEAIQLDFSSKNGFPHFGDWDGTPSRTVVIKNNYFGDSDTKGMATWPVGVGSHSGNNQEWNENITITGNTFKGMTYTGISAYNWNHVEIRDNTFSGIDEVITIEHPGNRLKEQDIVIENNVND